MRRNNPRLMINNLGMWAGMSAGFNKGSEMTGTNTQDDGNVQTIMEKAGTEWRKWATENNISPTNTTPETYMLMQDAFVDGYTNGFVKRFTEGG